MINNFHIIKLILILNMHFIIFENSFDPEFSDKIVNHKESDRAKGGGRLKIGDLLVSAGAINEDHLKKGLQLQKQKGMQLGKVLIQLGFTTQAKIMEVLSEQLELPSLSLGTYHIDTESLAHINENFARMKKILPLFQLNNDTLTITMVDPLDVFTLVYAR